LIEEVEVLKKHNYVSTPVLWWPYCPLTSHNLPYWVQSHSFVCIWTWE